MNADIHQARPVNDWDLFLQQSRSDIGYKQTSWWADFLKCRDWRSFGLVLTENNQIHGGANVLVNPFADGKCYYYVPHGPVLPDDPADAAEIFAAVIDFIDHRRHEETQLVSHLRLEPHWLRRPDFVREFQEASSWHEPRNSLWIDLSPPADDILKQMKPKGRYNIRVARRHGVTVVEDHSSTGLADFMRLYKATVERQHLRRRSTDYFRSLAETLFPFGRGSIFFAEYRGDRIAAVLTIYSGDTATYQYGGTVLSQRAVMAPYLLHFEVMLRAKELGHKWYDMYGVSPQGKREGSWANISAFKRKFGGREMAYVPALDLIYDDNAYQEFRKMKKRN